MWWLPEGTTTAAMELVRYLPKHGKKVPSPSPYKPPAGSCAELAASDQPRAGTPLLDAVGHSVTLLDKRKVAGERCILAVMMDGLENASLEYAKELHRR